jgi:hypothetical protein
MSLLEETLTSFLLFISEPWFLTNYETQLAVLQLCWEELAHLIVHSPEEETFVQHVSHLIHTHVEKKGGNFLAELVEEIDGGDYLLSRGWFCKSAKRQVSVFMIVMHGYSHLINPVDPDFDEHIESICQQILQDRQTAREEVLVRMIDDLSIINNQPCPPPLRHRDVTDELYEIWAEDYPSHRLIRSHGVTEDTVNYGIAWLPRADGVYDQVFCDLDRWG